MSFPRRKLKYVATLNDETLPDVMPDDFEITYAEISDVSLGAPIRWQKEVKFSDAPSRARRIVKDGDILVSTVRTYLKGIARVEGAAINAVVSTGFAALRPRELSSRFLGYVAQSQEFIDEVVSRSVGVSYPAIAPSDLLNILVPVPSDLEQRAIADYLDRETAEIDAFIADLDEYSTLLSHRLGAERDRTFLSLSDSSAPVPLKRWLKIPLSYGATAAADHFDPNEVRYLRITDFGAEGGLRPDVATSLPHEAAAGYMTAPGDILLARSGATVGKAFVVPDSLPEACFAGYLVRARCQSRVEASFVWHALQTTRYKDWISANATVATIQNVSAQKFGTYRIPRPSLAKQAKVIEELDRTQKNIEASQALAAEARALAKERRLSLISAAVTGQIDVAAQGMSAAEQLQDELEVHP